MTSRLKQGRGAFIIPVFLCALWYTGCTQLPGEKSLPPTVSPALKITPTPQLTIVATSTPPTVSPSQLQYNWLKGIPCAPPCFEGLIPGKTTADEAENILKNNPQVSQVTKKEFDSNGGSISWTWVKPPLRINNYTAINAVISYRKVKGSLVIYRISPGFGETSFTIGEVIQAYGEPTYVVAKSVLQETGGDSYSVDFIYLDKGFLVRTYKYSKPSSKPNINADLVLNYGVEFYETGIEGLLKNYSFNKNKLVPWQGYNSFDFYCQAYNGSKCIDHL